MGLKYHAIACFCFIALGFVVTQIDSKMNPLWAAPYTLLIAAPCIALGIFLGMKWNGLI